MFRRLAMPCRRRTPGSRKQTIMNLILTRAHPAAPDGPAAIVGARVCDPQRVACRTNAENSFQTIFPIDLLRFTEPRSGAVSRCALLTLASLLALAPAHAALSVCETLL